MVEDTPILSGSDFSAADAANFQDEPGDDL